MGVALRAHVFGCGHLRHLAGASPTTHTLLRCSAPGHCSLALCWACATSPWSLQMADLAWLLLLGPGVMGSPSSPRSAAIWGAFRCVVPPRPPAGRTRPPARNGFRFLRLHGRWAGSDRCGGALSIPAHRAIIIVCCLTCLVCLVQVYGVGGGDLRRMADFRRASRAEIECWVAEEKLFSGLLGTAEPARTLGRGPAC